MSVEGVAVRPFALAVVDYIDQQVGGKAVALVEQQFEVAERQVVLGVSQINSAVVQQQIGVQRTDFEFLVGLD